MSALDEFIYDEAPCDFCPLAARCRLGEACPQLESFVLHGGHKWRALPRQPSAELYARLYIQ